MRHIVAALALVVCPSVAAAQSDSVLFRIDMNALISAGAFDPASQGVGVRGGLPPLTWTESLVAVDPDEDGMFEVGVFFPAVTPDDQPVAYKFKVDDPADPFEGWEDGPNRFFIRTGPGQVVARAFGSSQAPLPPTYTGDIRVHKAFASEFVQSRDVFVYLPPHYDTDPDRHFPVLYLHDGQNVFDVRAVGAEWRVDETAERLIQSGEVEPFLVVGVANTPARIDEYTPTRSRLRPDLPAMGGLGNAYGRFLVEELKPFIDRTYRTLPEPGATALGGSSLGGLITLYLGLQYPGTYGALLVVSPSIWWENQRILQIVRSLPARTSQRIWLDMGTAESPTAIEDARQLRAALEAKKWIPEVDLLYVEDEGAGHSEAAWARRVDGMLRFLYAPPH